MPQAPPPVTQAEFAVSMLHDVDHRARCWRVRLSGLDLQHLALEAASTLGAELTLVVQRANLAQRLARAAPGLVQISRLARCHGEAPVVLLQVRAQPFVGLLDACDALQPQCFAQAVLQRLEQPLHPALGLWRVGADGLDVKLQQRALELRRLGVFGVGFGEDAVAVAVQGQRRAVALYDLVQHGEVRLGGFLWRELRAKHLACSVVDEGDQAALVSTALEPVVVAAVDLHQLAHAGAALARAVHALGPAQPGLPQPGFDYPAAERLGAVDKAVISRQVLARQLGAEVGVVLAHQRDELLALQGRDPPVARNAALARDQPRWPLLANSPAQPFDLPYRYTQYQRSLRLAHLARHQPLHNRVPLRFLLTHQPLPHLAHLCLLAARKGTLLSGAKGTLPFGAHTGRALKQVSPAIIDAMAIQTDDFQPDPGVRRVLSAAPASPGEEAIERALREHGIEIPFPQRELHIRAASGPGPSDSAGGSGPRGSGPHPA